MPDPLSSPFNLQNYLNDKQDIVNQALIEIVDKRFRDTRLCEAMKYSLMASGKRLRPILCMASAELFAKINHAIVLASCAIEMTHTYSLIHDDLPAMDNDALRRGVPTCHIQFNEATAILAGDALLTVAFELLSSPELVGHSRPQHILEIINILANAAGYEGMIEGQMRDIQSERAEINLDSLNEIHLLKTGALIEASVKIGAILGGATLEHIKPLSSYARNIGLAFQVVDDILNVEGDHAIMGKATGTDKTKSKSTFPSFIGLGESKIYARTLVNNALQAISFFGTKAIPLSALATYVIERKR